MNKKMFMVIVLCAYNLIAKAQYLEYGILPYTPVSATTPVKDQTVYATFSITSAALNDADISAAYVSEDTKIVIYAKNDLQGMSIIHLKTGAQAYGEISAIQSAQIPSTTGNNNVQQRKFTWNLRYSDKAKAQDAAVTITEEKKPGGTIFKCEMKTVDRDYIFTGTRER